MANTKKPPKTVDQAPAAKDFSSEIEKSVRGVLENKIPAHDLTAVTDRITQLVISEKFSGPMPHPKHLEEYDQIIPNGADRILTMAEQSLTHNMELEKAMLIAEKEDRKLGMVLGAFLFAMLIILGFASLFLSTNPLVPAAFLGTAAIGGVAAFIRGR